jgi:CheY-like chemotaxis protein
MSIKNSIHTAILIDDSEADLIILQRFIEISHFAKEVVTFNSPVEALKTINACSYSGSTMIFLDLHMPMMDGFEFLQSFNTIGNNANDFNVIFLSGSENMSDQQRAMQFPNVVRFITKSSDFDWLDLLILNGWQPNRDAIKIDR